jgi:hypothetical protein
MNQDQDQDFCSSGLHEALNLLSFISAKQSYRKKENHMLLIIKANFQKDDLQEEEEHIIDTMLSLIISGKNMISIEQ